MKHVFILLEKLYEPVIEYYGQRDKLIGANIINVFATKAAADRVYDLMENQKDLCIEDWRIFE